MTDFYFVFKLITRINITVNATVKPLLTIISTLTLSYDLKKNLSYHRNV